MIAHWHSNLCSATRIRIYTYKLLSLRLLAFPFLKEWFRFYRYIVIFNAWIKENVMTQNTYKTSESLSLMEIEIFQRDATIPKRQFPRCFLCRDLCHRSLKQKFYGTRVVCVELSNDSPSRCVEIEKKIEKMDRPDRKVLPKYHRV